MGGFVPLINHFSKNTFELDGHRSLMIAKTSFFNGRSDHSLYYNEGKIYVLVSMSYQAGSYSKLISLND